jgi:hypothetical protein
VGSPVVRNASIIDHPDGAFLLSCLSNARRALVVSRGTRWSLIVAWGALIVITFLPTISCEVTGLSAEETCKDFPLSVLLDGSSGVSSFFVPPYTLFVSVSSWEKIFCFGYSGARSSWGSIHCIWILLRVSPLAIERLRGISGWWPLCFETVGPVPHMDVNSLLIDCRCLPLFICCGLWEVS